MLLFSVGSVTALAGVLVHPREDVGVPWGLVLSLAAAAAVVRAGALLAHSAVGAGAVAAGWTVLVLWLSSGRPEGDYAIASDWIGSTFAWGGLLLVAAAYAVSLWHPERPRDEQPRLGV